MNSQLQEVLRYFLRLGFLGFGGPLALISQMQSDLVDKKKWLSEAEFRRAFALIKAMPGPVATQMAIYLAKHRAGFWGGLLGGLVLIAPAFAMMLFLAATYEKFEELVWMKYFMAGLQMAALAVIFFALRGLTRVYWSVQKYWILLIPSFALLYFKILPEYFLIFAGGCASLLWDKKIFWRKISSFVWMPGVASLNSISSSVSSVIPIPQSSESVVALGSLFWTCFKAGAFAFGTGYAIIPGLQNDFVHVYQWATLNEFRDALAFGQMTPGPVVITVTFLGYKAQSWIGAGVATFAVFVPCFFHQLTWFPWAMHKLKDKSWIDSFLLGAIAIVSAGILVAAVEMMNGITLIQGLILISSLLLLLRYKIQSSILILGGGLVSLSIGWFGF